MTLRVSNRQACGLCENLQHSSQRSVNCPSPPGHLNNNWNFLHLSRVPCDLSLRGTTETVWTTCPWSLWRHRGQDPTPTVGSVVQILITVPSCHKCNIWHKSQLLPTNKPLSFAQSSVVVRHFVVGRNAWFGVGVVVFLLLLILVVLEVPLWMTLDHLPRFLHVNLTNTTHLRSSTRPLTVHCTLQPSLTPVH